MVLSFSKEELVSKGWVISILDWQLFQNQRTTVDLKALFSKNQRIRQITIHLKPSIFVNSFNKPTTYSLKKSSKFQNWWLFCIKFFTKTRDSLILKFSYRTWSYNEIREPPPNTYSSKLYIHNFEVFCLSNSTGAQYLTLQIKIGWRKVNNASLAYQNGFAPPLLHSLLRLVKGTVKPYTCQRRV